MKYALRGPVGPDGKPSQQLFTQKQCEKMRAEIPKMLSDQASLEKLSFNELMSCCMIRAKHDSQKFPVCPFVIVTPDQHARLLLVNLLLKPVSVPCSTVQAIHFDLSAILGIKYRSIKVMLKGTEVLIPARTAKEIHWHSLDVTRQVPVDLIREGTCLATVTVTINNRDYDLNALIYIGKNSDSDISATDGHFTLRPQKGE